MRSNQILFYIVIFLANIIHGITGFAGTVLAMPFSIRLVGYEVAKPVLNVLGIVSGIYVFAENKRYVNWKEVGKIVGIMSIGILGGVFVRHLFVGKEQMLYALLGIFVIVLAVKGLYSMSHEERSDGKGKVLLLPLAGIAHGIFVSGGPLLISYLTTKIRDKISFRATISTVWIFLNTLILLDDIRNGYWTASLVKVQLISLPFLLGGMYLGGILVKKMSQNKFMKLTYILLIISGVSLLVK